jgi:hypothetical protein
LKNNYQRIYTEAEFKSLIEKLRVGFETGNLDVKENNQISKNLATVGKEFIFRWVK